jgi:hypothetical protein
MKTFLSGCSFLLVLIAAARAGTTETFDKRVADTATLDEWYAAREFNIQLWGTYAFTSNEYRQDSIERDRYLKADHASGGGIDAKYFFNRYLGLGLEGYAASRTASFPYLAYYLPAGLTYPTLRDTSTIGAGLATFTLRWPIGSSRFAPYALLGGGFITGGGQRLQFEYVGYAGHPPGTSPFRAYTDYAETKAVGQVGAGLEIRLTRHLGWVNDFTWNIVDGRLNNFGMARSGINFAF